MDTGTTPCQTTRVGTAPLNCELYAYSVSPHVSQLYTGFFLLAKAGQIKLRQKCADFPYRRGFLRRKKSPPHGLFVVINRKRTVFYDMRDGHKLDSEVLDVADAYFKRSYLESSLPPLRKHKIHSLGFNYAIYPDGFDPYELQRILARYKNPLALARGLAFVVRKVAKIGAEFIPTVSQMCSRPRLNQQPGILFSADAWDPDELPVQRKSEREERMGINITRARCIQLLKKEFGNHFYGGFAHSKYAVENFQHVLLPDRRTADKQTYLGLVRQYPICVATTGLYGSIGWKMAEYIAFSKAIVSEKFKYSVPGSFTRGKNYLDFTTPEECVDQAVRIFNDRQLQEQMMKDNWQYYESFMKPDRLIWRTLEAG